MTFIPRSSNQFHCYRFRLRFVKRKRRSGSSQHLRAAAKHHGESVSRPPPASRPKRKICTYQISWVACRAVARRRREPLTLTIWKPFDISSFPQGKGRQNWPALRGYGPSFDTFLTVLRKPAEREEMAAGELHVKLPGS